MDGLVVLPLEMVDAFLYGNSYPTAHSEITFYVETPV